MKYLLLTLIIIITACSNESMPTATVATEPSSSSEIILKTKLTEIEGCWQQNKKEHFVSIDTTKMLLTSNIKDLDGGITGDIISFINDNGDLKIKFNQFIKETGLYNEKTVLVYKMNGLFNKNVEYLVIDIGKCQNISDEPFCGEYFFTKTETCF